MRIAIESLEGRTLFDALSLDSTFGTGGTVEFSGTGPGQAGLSAVAVQSDGKIVVVQTTSTNFTSYSSVVRRLLANGSVDTSFGTDGVTTLPTASSSSGVDTILVEPSKKILVAAGADIVQLDSNGSFDTSFGSGTGVVPISATGMALQSDGKIIVADGGGVLRLNSDGSSDTTYNDGYSTELGNNGFQNYVTGGVAVDSSGRAVVSIGGRPIGDGTAGLPDQVGTFAVERLTTSGQVDTTFGINGMANDGGQEDDAGYSPLAIAPDGTIFQGDDYDLFDGDESNVTGYSPTGSISDYYITQHAAGNPHDSDVGLTGFAFDSNNDTLISGFLEPFDGSSTGQVVLGDDGTVVLDESDGGNYTQEVAWSIAVKPTGQIVIAGTSTGSTGGPPVIFTVTQLIGNAVGSVSGTVYNDVNGDGVQQSGETGLAGRTVYDDLNNNGILDPGEPSTVTSANGSYTLTALPTGNAIIRQVLPSGWHESFPSQGAGDHVTLGSSTVTGVNFGATTSVYISGIVFSDANGNGVQDSGETGIGGVSVYIDTTNAGVFKAGDPQTTTNSAGVYNFTGLAAGTYIVRQILPSGDKQIFPALGYGNHITVAAGQVVINANFADQKTAVVAGSITGTVFNDVNGNSKQDAGETGIANVTVYIDTTNAGVFKAGDPQTTTNSAGNYTFTGLPAGAYIVRQILPGGDKQIFPTLGYGNHVTLAAGQAVTNANFADQGAAVMLASISGTVFNDANGNGVQDSGELGIAGVVLYIDLDNAGIFQTGDPQTTTNSSGVYTFTGLSAGTYIVRQVLPAGDTQTSPTKGYGNHVTVTAGQAAGGANFGDKA